MEEHRQAHQRELIEHDREVLNIMHQTSRTRLAWERDLP